MELQSLFARAITQGSLFFEQLDNPEETINVKAVGRVLQDANAKLEVAVFNTALQQWRTNASDQLVMPSSYATHQAISRIMKDILSKVLVALVLIDTTK